jgi:hypothetical protein
MMSGSLFPGNGGRVREALGLRTLDLDPPPEWQHPWWTTPRWNPSGLSGPGWEATVKAGTVNGRAPVMALTATIGRGDDPRDFGVNPLTGQPFFSASVFGSSTLSTPTTQSVNVPLYLRPAIALQWEALGFDSTDGATAVPQFFLDRGASLFPGGSDATGFDGVTIDASGNVTTTNAPAGLRLLRKCDLILHQPRVAIGQQTTSGGKTLLGIVPPSPTDTLRVFAGQFDENEFSNPAANDQPFDERIVSRVYALSPPNAPLDAEPDGSWQCFVAHSLFWNLQWSQKALPASTFTGQPDAAGIQALGQVLAGGVAAGSIDAISSITTSGLQSLALDLSTNTLAGSFWTPTGGGTSAQLPVSTPDLLAGIPGAAKSRLLLAQRLIDQQQITQESLDPDFPYTALPFDLTLLAPAS